MVNGVLVTVAKKTVLNLASGCISEASNDILHSSMKYLFLIDKKTFCLITVKKYNASP